jgi:hypothetical protein
MVRALASARRGDLATVALVCAVGTDTTTMMDAKRKGPAVRSVEFDSRGNARWAGSIAELELPGLTLVSESTQRIRSTGTVPGYDPYDRPVAPIVRCIALRRL